LRHRDRTGLGQHIDVAMFDAMVSMTDLVTNFWSLGLRPAPGQGLAMILDGFEASNGWFIIQVGREHEFERLANLIGKPEWLTDPRFVDLPSRLKNIDALEVEIEKVFATKPTAHWVEKLDAAQVPGGPVYTYAQILDDPHIKARKMVIEYDHPKIGRMKSIGIPIKSSGELTAIRQPAPWLGQHSAETVHELGISGAEIETLFAEGVLYDKYRTDKPA
jgi:crotonobetainyl-CoA:carnitine CoA-transferase CaiB-like acyl-CoA transferase